MFDFSFFLKNISFLDIYVFALSIYLIKYYLNIIKNLILHQSIIENLEKSHKFASTKKKGNLVKSLIRKFKQKKVKFNENMNEIHFQ